jgi:hypothetical protein
MFHRRVAEDAEKLSKKGFLNRFLCELCVSAVIISHGERN